jgi:hypothetical protein
MRYWLRSLAGRTRHLVMGGLVMLAVSAATAVLSFWPEWQSVPEDAGLVRLSFTHSAGRICRDRTPAELAALPPNMRALQVCERRRAPVRVEMDVDGVPVVVADLPPTGLAGSGPSRAYKRLVLPAGDYEIALRLRDDPTVEDFTHQTVRRLTLAPGQNVAIDFRGATGDFVFY